MRSRLLLFTIVLVTLTLACSLPGSQPASPEPKTVETSVAATLTAVASASEGETAEPPASAATETPSAEPTTPSVDADLVVVYTHQGNPWVIVDDEPPRQLSQAGDTVDVLISDDARRIVFIRLERSQNDPEPVEVRAVNLDGTNEVVLLEKGELDSLYPLEDFLHYNVSSIKFIPDTHQLLLNTRGLFAGPGLIKNDDLLRLDSNTGELTQLLSRGQGGDFHPSPDGSRLVLVQPDSVSLADIDGSNLQSDVLTFDPIITYSEFQYYPPVLWQDDSQAAGMVIPNPDILADNLFGTAWRLPRDGGAAEQLLQVNGMVYFPQQSGGSVLSPTFDRLVTIQGEQGARELTLVDLPNGQSQIYDTGAIEWKGWAPDGQHFIYSKGEPTEIQLGTLGSAPQALVSGIDFQWTNASDFLFLSGSQENWTLRAGTTEGSVEDLAQSDSRFTEFDFATP